MFGLRSLVHGAIRGRSQLLSVPHGLGPAAGRVRRSHEEGPPQPFDNMPFRIASKHAATIFFAFFFGAGLWAPFIIVWYSMAKKTM